MSEVETALLGALRDLQHPGDFDRTAVVRQTDAELSWTGSVSSRRCWQRPLRRRLGGGPQAHPCRSPATKKGRCGLHRDASGSGGPAGERNGQYRHGERTKAAIAERRKFRALLKMLRAGLT